MTLTELLVCLGIVGLIAGMCAMLARGTRSAGESQAATAERKLSGYLRELDEAENIGGRL